jgi:uncharacterized protein YceH (UPF0502 family)
VELTAEEGRVLGCLVEKQLTTPQQYPLTENALLVACNQTTSRDPVVQYDAATVRLAVRSLRERDLLRTVHRSGERSDKHRHQLEEAVSVTTPQQALLALLLLRGPQTAAELRTRADRMHAFATTEEVEAELETLGRREQPLVTRLDRQPGQKGARFAQTLVEASTTPLDQDELSALRAEVVSLRTEVTALRAQLADQNLGGSV